MPPKTQWVMQRMGSVLLCLFLNACEQVRFMKVFRITEYQSLNFKNIDKVWMGNSLLTLRAVDTWHLRTWSVGMVRVVGAGAGPRDPGDHLQP